MSGRWWRNVVVGLGSGQRECCGVGKASVAGWDDDSGGCAIALLGQWWHCQGMMAVTGMDRWALRCRNRRATAAGVKGMLQSTCCWVFATSLLKLLQLPQSLEPPPHYLSAIYPHMESVLNRRWWHQVSGIMVPMRGNGMMGRGATGDASLGLVEAQADRDGRMRMMRLGGELRGTTRVGDNSQRWAVAQQEANMDGKQTNCELGRQA